MYIPYTYIHTVCVQSVQKLKAPKNTMKVAAIIASTVCIRFAATTEYIHLYVLICTYTHIHKHIYTHTYSNVCVHTLTCISFTT
jgi:hypothetical protein